MEISEFIEATARLEKYYNKEYTKEQRVIMFDELCQFSIERYRHLVSQTIRKCKFLPKVSDFIEIDADTPYKSDLQEEKIKTECKKCNSTGYIVYRKKIGNGNDVFYNEYASICNCGNAKVYKGWDIKDVKNRSNFYTPVFEKLGLR